MDMEAGKTLTNEEVVSCLLYTSPPFLISVEVRVLLPHDVKQTALNGDKQLVHIGLVGFPAAAEIRIGQFHICLLYTSRCV